MQEGCIILKWISKNAVMKLQASYNAGREYNIKMDLQEFGDEPSGLIQCRQFLERPRNCQLLRKDPAVWS